jgi:hypothetical protein
LKGIVFKKKNHHFFKSITLVVRTNVNSDFKDVRIGDLSSRFVVPSVYFGKRFRHHNGIKPNGKRKPGDQNGYPVGCSL